jgi:hypothetical protein
MMRAWHKALLTAVLIVLCTCGRAWSVDALCLVEGREIFRLRVVNEAGGQVAVSRDGGVTWRSLGTVLRYTTQVNRRGYTASKWIAAGHVAATAVNAIHISAGYEAEQDRGVVFSILPREFLAPQKESGSFLSPTSSIYTDIPAGEGIFGGGDAPVVGSPVCLETEAGSGIPPVMTPVSDGYVPSRGDVLVIVVLRPEPYPIAAEFDNRPGGEVALVYPDGARKMLGWVIRPVGGIGRFEGSVYTGIGRLRANHAGVVDISTSPDGFLGAFQIIPVGHALSPEMELAWRRTQWMIVGPVEEASPLWEGLMPLFCQYLRPDYLAGDLYGADWESRLLARFLVDVTTGDGQRSGPDWQPMPCRRLAADPTVPLPEWADSALGQVTRIRILFPLGGGPGTG